MGCSSGIVSPAISIVGGWYVWTIDIGRMEFERCSLVRRGVGESLEGAAACLGSAEPIVSDCEGIFCGDPENEVEVGDFGAPKAVMNERTMQGLSMHCANVSL